MFCFKILSKSQKKFSKSSSLNENVKSNKKAVRFADSLGLELESFITLHQMDSNAHRRRVIRLANQNTNFNHQKYQQQAIQNQYNQNANNLIYNKNHLAYATSKSPYYQQNSNEKFNFAKTYNNQSPYNNITHFNNDKVLRHQGHEARRYIETNNNTKKINQFEDPNGQCLYDDIINKIAFNSNDGKYQRPQQGSRVYINNNSSSDKSLNGGGSSNVPYFLMNILT